MKLSAVFLSVVVVVSSACASHAPPRAPRENSKAVQQLRSDLATIFDAPRMARGTWGVDIRSADNGSVIFQHNAERLMMPASNMKILTMAIAAETLGWDHRFVTTLESAAPVEAGVLRGDLVIRGTGDPTISTRGGRAKQVLDEWAQALRSAGIQEIDGRIVGDDQAFDDEGLGPGWSWDYLDAGYASPIGALQFNENVAELTVTAGAAPGEPTVARLQPGSGLDIVNLARTTAASAERASQAAIDARRRVDRPAVEISGTMPVGVPPATRMVAVVNPTLFFVQGVKDALVARGITVRGEAVDGDDIAADLERSRAAETKALHRTESPTLREIGAVLMKVSQNQYGETLLKAVGAKRGGLGTTSAGRRAAAEAFSAWSVPADAYVMSDGSGLSRYNYVAPAAVTAVLRRMYTDPMHRDSFIATLPIAAKDGTISSRMRNTRAAGNAVAKTGSIANVRSLSGFVRTRDGELLVFSIIANDFVVPSAVVTWTADLAVETLANYTRR